MTRYYDPKNNRLVFIENSATENYWDEHWEKMDVSMLYKPRVPPFHFVVNTTRKYLTGASLILEGGQGLRKTVGICIWRDTGQSLLILPRRQ